MGVSFNPERDIPDLAGKVIVVTGGRFPFEVSHSICCLSISSGNSGLGEATIAHYAAHNAGKIYMGARSKTKALDAITRIKANHPKANIEYLGIDLASFDSIKRAASQFNASESRLDILQANGGICVPPFAVTKEGYEIQTGTNYMGHALLIQLLLPKMLATSKLPKADVRIVMMSSIGLKRFSWPKDDKMDWNLIKTDGSSTSGFQLYDLSMLTKAQFAYALARRYPQLTVTSVHPGLVSTGVADGTKQLNFLSIWAIKLFIALIASKPEVGTHNQVWCSVGKDVISGRYYEPVGVKDTDPRFASDPNICDSLWDWTSSELLSHGGPGWVSSR